MAGWAHVTLSVGDHDRSVRWYGDVLGFQPLATETTDRWRRTLCGHAESGTILVIHRHLPGSGQEFDERRTGRDHVALAVPDPEALLTWQQRLSAPAVQHSPVADARLHVVARCWTSVTRTGSRSSCSPGRRDRADAPCSGPHGWWQICRARHLPGPGTATGHEVDGSAGHDGWSERLTAPGPPLDRFGNAGPGSIPSSPPLGHGAGTAWRAERPLRTRMGTVAPRCPETLEGPT